MKFFLDLDGTLIDVSRRHYTIYKEVTEQFHGMVLSQPDYWQLKRAKTEWRDILPKSGLSVDLLDDYLEEFRKKIEDEAYLRIDTLYQGTLDVLDMLKHRGNCYVISLRRKHENMRAQLEWLGLAPYFTKVLSGHSETDGLDVKVPLIRAELGDDTGVIIGDTGTEIKTGQALHMTTIAVTQGLCEERLLTALHPDYIVPTIADVPAVLE